MSLPISTSPQETDRIARQIFDLVRLSESGTGVGYPGSGQEYIVNALLGSPERLKQLLGRYYRRHCFLPVAVAHDDTPETVLARMADTVTARHITLPAPLTFRLLMQRLVHQGLSPYIFLFKAERLPAKELNAVLAMMHDVLLETNAVGAQVFFEADIYADPIQTILRRNHKFLSNILTRPVYGFDEVRYFIRSVGTRYGMKITESRYQELYAAFGGCLWLQKEALRYLRTHPNASVQDIVTHPLMDIKIRSLFDRFTADEKSALARICMENDTDIPLAIRQYVEELNIVRRTKDGYALTIPALTMPLSAYFTDRKLSATKDGSIRFGERDITNAFTPAENALLRLLLGRHGSLVTREQAAEALWGHTWEEKYSDWAMDKLISRLRTSLAGIGLPRQTVVTRKKRGFMIP